MLFFGVWLLYGFCAGQIVVWYCRKNILALLVSLIVGAAAFGLWLPSLLCRGMSGWQMLLPALTMLLATWCLMRVWTSGRIRERKPTTALVGFIATVLVWACLNFGYRAWEMPDVGSPMDTTAFRAQIPFSKDNLAAREVDQALGKIDEPNDAWLAPIAEMARLPVGVLEVPRADGQRPLLIHLPKCQRITAGLLRHAQASEPEPAFEYLAQILSLSRNLRNKAPVESYLVGIETEESALNGLDLLLGRGKPTPKLLRRILDELNRHAAETPPPLDCLLTECLRSGGALANPSVWTLAVPERWLVGSIALSMETPWESERKTRLWQLVWAGLFRAMETPYWQLPEAVEFRTENDSTRAILSAWLPAPDGPGANVTRARLIPLLDESWLADERLFCNVARLRDASTRAQWRVDATRQAIALCLYGIDEQKAAAAVEDLVPKYLPERLPLDPYSGQRFRYRIADEQRLEGIGDILPGQAILWSTGPDRIDHGGRRHGGHLRDDSPLWRRGDFDLITLVPLSR